MIVGAAIRDEESGFISPQTEYDYDGIVVAIKIDESDQQPPMPGWTLCLTDGAGCDLTGGLTTGLKGSRLVYLDGLSEGIPCRGKITVDGEAWGSGPKTVKATVYIARY